MNGAIARILALTIALSVASIPAQETCAENREADRLSFRIERDARRFGFAGTDNVMTILAIRPGMTILDIGTGTGQFAYEFARRLRGTGAVYATDTRAYCVDYVKAEADRRGLRNLRPVLVAAEGLDPFYRTRRYDLIAIFHVAMPYEKQADYLRQLRGTLAEGGRLAVVAQKVAVPFTVGDFGGGFRGIVGELSREPEDSPFLQILKETTRRMIRDDPGGEPSDTLGRAIVEDFNEALRSDAGFFGKFPDGAAFGEEIAMSPGERAFADFLAASLRGRISPNANIARQDPGARARAKTGDAGDPDAMLLNKLIIARRFRAWLAAGNIFAPGVGPEAVAAFVEAGYRVERADPDVIPLEDLVIFSAR